MFMYVYMSACMYVPVLLSHLFSPKCFYLLFSFACIQLFSISCWIPYFDISSCIYIHTFTCILAHSFPSFSNSADIISTGTRRACRCYYFMLLEYVIFTVIVVVVAADVFVALLKSFDPARCWPA